MSLLERLVSIVTSAKEFRFLRWFVDLIVCRYSHSYMHGISLTSYLIPVSLGEGLYSREYFLVLWLLTSESRRKRERRPFSR